MGFLTLGVGAIFGKSGASSVGRKPSSKSGGETTVEMITVGMTTVDTRIPLGHYFVELRAAGRVQNLAADCGIR
jgi:hypothetical protein